MTGQVQGKVALVTGGASGIGAAVAELLAREGASVAVTDIDDLKGPEVVAGIKKAGHEAVFLHQDVTSEARWVEVVAEVEKRFGRLDILVSNAGIGIAVPSIVDMSLEDWRRQTAINLDGVFLSVKHCLPAMRRTGGGSIIMMSSLAGLRGAPGLSGYCATKGGVRLFAKAIAMECASARRRHPGQLGASRHYRHADLGQDSNGSGGERTETRRSIPKSAPKLATPLGRAGHASEIAQRRVVSGVRCIELRDRDGTGHRRRHERGRRGAERRGDDQRSGAHDESARRMPQPRQPFNRASTFSPP